jgi:hypothetical protein
VSAGPSVRAHSADHPTFDVASVKSNRSGEQAGKPVAALGALSAGGSNREAG